MQQAIPFSNGRTWMPLPSPAALLAGRTFPPLPHPQEPQPTPTTTASTTTAAAPSTTGGVHAPTTTTALRRLVAENPVLVLGRRGCCMCHVIRRLLLGLGVNPAVCELDDARADEAAAQLAREVPPGEEGQGGSMQLPAVFIGGGHVGGLDRLMAKHISGDLVPMLKQAGALWL